MEPPGPTVAVTKVGLSKFGSFAQRKRGGMNEAHKNMDPLSFHATTHKVLAELAVLEAQLLECDNGFTREAISNRPPCRLRHDVCGPPCADNENSTLVHNQKLRVHQYILSTPMYANGNHWLS